MLGSELVAKRRELRVVVENLAPEIFVPNSLGHTEPWARTQLLGELPKLIPIKNAE
jgi:hypothetical protein